MHDKRVLVTGGAGFIGQRVVDLFSTAGWAVRSLSLPGSPRPDRWSRDVEALEGDVLDGDFVRGACKGCDLVIHLAGLVGHPGDYQRQWDVFVGGTRNVCLAAADVGARIVVTTSIAVYGTFIQSHVCTEDIGHGPWAGAYGRAKQGQEFATFQLAARYGIAATVLRPANVYGFGGGGAWGDRLLAAIQMSGSFLIGEADHNDAGLVHVDNLADAVLIAGTHQDAIGEVYNVCDEGDVTWGRFLRDMARLSDQTTPHCLELQPVLDAISENECPAKMEPPRSPALPFLESVNLVGFSNRIPSSKLRETLGWKPRRTYPEVMASALGTR